jgi:exopolyphosphatase
LDIIQPAGESEYCDTYFRDLVTAKANVTHLTNYDLLRKDFKHSTTNGYHFGIASVTWDFQSWARREGPEGHVALQQALQEFARERRLDLVMVLTSHYDPESGFQREILIYPLNENLKKDNELIRKFEMSDLNLVRKHVHWTRVDSRMYVYQQNNTISSRKQVLPLTKRVLEGFKSKT